MYVLFVVHYISVCFSMFHYISLYIYIRTNKIDYPIHKEHLWSDLICVGSRWFALVSVGDGNAETSTSKAFGLLGPVFRYTPVFKSGWAPCGGNISERKCMFYVCS